MTGQPGKRITVDAPDGATIHPDDMERWAAVLDGKEGRP
jgi:hypothetical protein